MNLYRVALFHLIFFLFPFFLFSPSVTCTLSLVSSFPPPSPHLFHFYSAKLFFFFHFSPTSPPSFIFPPFSASLLLFFFTCFKIFPPFKRFPCPVLPFSTPRFPFLGFLLPSFASSFSSLHFFLPFPSIIFIFLFFSLLAFPSPFLAFPFSLFLSFPSPSTPFFFISRPLFPFHFFLFNSSASLFPFPAFSSSFFPFPSLSMPPILPSPASYLLFAPSLHPPLGSLLSSIPTKFLPHVSLSSSNTSPFLPPRQFPPPHPPLKAQC